MAARLELRAGPSMRPGEVLASGWQARRRSRVASFVCWPPPPHLLHTHPKSHPHPHTLPAHLLIHCLLLQCVPAHQLICSLPPPPLLHACTNACRCLHSCAQSPSPLSHNIPSLWGSILKILPLQLCPAPKGQNQASSASATRMSDACKC